ncbi:hypothetical protein J421_0603 [Gemmatirosa kalamazoonensis]|uniref:Uncharacterized protein n=1 Tax=Gemmatirosa kalamazoonensis TaxID=861299 RepID=W0RCT9_9BACT|nr:hypothetical protein [Gemmatirosa kalamazoonensis]AHG88140.1 hypothetical protein J421_0603 [Gemmatirosa kalamazoonensis]
MPRMRAYVVVLSGLGIGYIVGPVTGLGLAVLWLLMAAPHEMAALGGVVIVPAAGMVAGAVVGPIVGVLLALAWLAYRRYARPR